MSLHFLRAGGESLVLRSAMLAALVFGFAATPSRAVNVFVGFDDGTIIYDGLLGDLDGLVNDQITFNGVYGTAGYQLSGQVFLTPPNPVGASLSGFSPPITGSVTMTNFVGEAIALSTGGTCDIRFEGEIPGSFGAGVAVDVITAEVGNSFSSPVPAGTDFLNYWQGIVYDNFGGGLVTPATGAALPLGNPAHPGPGTTPYLVSGHGPWATPAFTNPKMHGAFQFQLGALGDQFILPSSAEVGFSAVPEPGTMALMGLGLLGLAVVGRRARRRETASGK